MTTAARIKFHGKAVSPKQTITVKKIKAGSGACPAANKKLQKRTIEKSDWRKSGKRTEQTRNNKTNHVYRLIPSAQRKRMAGAPGFEPGNGGTKNRCLTAWRRPSRRADN